MSKIDIWGSCVSRIATLDGDQKAHGISIDGYDIGYFFNKANIVCEMMPPPFSNEEIESISIKELWDKDKKNVARIKAGTVKSQAQHGVKLGFRVAYS